MRKGGSFVCALCARAKILPSQRPFLSLAVELAKSVVGWMCCVGLQRCLGALRTVSWRRESQGGSHEPSPAVYYFSCEGGS